MSIAIADRALVRLRGLVSLLRYVSNLMYSGWIIIRLCYGTRLTLYFSIIMVKHVNFSFLSGNRMHRVMQHCPADFWLYRIVPYYSHTTLGEHSVKTILVTNARVYCVDELAENIVTERVVKVKTTFRPIVVWCGNNRAGKWY